MNMYIDKKYFQIKNSKKINLQKLEQNKEIPFMKTILGAYIVVQLLIISSLMMLQLSNILHLLSMAVSCIAYFVVAFKNPGYYQAQQQAIPTFDVSSKPKKQPSIEEKIIAEKIEEQDCQESINDDVQQISKKIQQKIANQNQQPAISCQSQPQNPELIQPKIPQNKQKISADNFMIAKKGKQTLRFCRICKVYQPYRVRHCHDCQKCICTFDHHCPWMDNCIGEKNRNTFWIYLLLQFTQLLIILVDIGSQTLMTNEEKLRLYFFAAFILLLTAMTFCMLSFHTFLMMKNLTTWQYVKWDKINYLSLYQSKKLSPFSFGLLTNLQDYFFPKDSAKEWTINPQFIQKCQQIKKISKENKDQKKITRQEPELKNKEKAKAKTEKVIIFHTFQ